MGFKHLDMNGHGRTMDPSPLSPPRLFNVVCVITILGNLLLIAANLFKAGMLYMGIQKGSVGTAAIGPLKLLLLVVVLTCMGAALGAALMLRGRRLGFRIYAVSNVVHLIATAGVMLLWIISVYLSSVGVLLFFYSFIPAAFLLYFRRSGAWLR